ncbi:MAG: GatB/YqeY domain-containing protein [Planctomycetota bacterium]
MELLDQLRSDMKSAMRAGEKDRLEVIRMLIAEVQSGELQSSPQPPEKVVASYHKRLKKSRDEYDKLSEAGRVAAIDGELAVVEQYVPDAPSPEKTSELVDAFLAENEGLGSGDIGRAMGQLMKKHPGQFDPGAANKRLREVLSQRG